MKVVAVIPVRMGASRFPGKPLAPLLGRPMLEHVFRRTQMCATLDDVLVATCDQEIVDACARFGATAVMTSDQHIRASDRVAEVASQLDADVIVMVQGDEPMVLPGMIDLALQPLIENPRVVCSNLAAPIPTVQEFEDVNTIKVVMASNGDALYFSRQPIPTRAKVSFAELGALKQVCVIPFRREFLLEYTELSPTPLEVIESIDMLRAIEHGFPVRLVRTDKVTHSVDTVDDIRMVERLMRADPLIERYSAAEPAG
jgi:3-deoxy-manno-octulosonate cytidylyltransferase (CMP-KDO synthetase)